MGDRKRQETQRKSSAGMGPGSAAVEGAGLRCSLVAVLEALLENHPHVEGIHIGSQSNQAAESLEPELLPSLHLRKAASSMRWSGNVSSSVDPDSSTGIIEALVHLHFCMLWSGGVGEGSVGL